MRDGRWGRWVLVVAPMLAAQAAAGCRPPGFRGGDDAGPAEPDAVVTPDAAIDAGPAPEAPMLAVACDDTVDAVYAASPDTSAPALARRGAILACAYEGFVPAFDVASRLAAVGATGVVPTTGVHSYRVAYQTTRRGDVPAVSSARVLLPATYARTPSPMLVAAHGTAGLADRCAPSRSPTQGDGLALPFAATGWPTIAPDYAGLGTEGIQGYGDNDDTARSQLDGARALRALLPEGTLSDAIVMDGHSQGGGVVLSAQAFERTYGAGGELALVLAFAPGIQLDRDVTGYRFPRVSTSLGSGAPAAIASLAIYAWHASALGPERAGEGFGAAARDELVAAIGDQCVFDLAASIPAIAPTFGDLVDETFRTGLLSCADGGACTGNAQGMWDFLGANAISPDPVGARVHVYTGSSDTLATPRDVACIVDYLEAASVTPTVCVDGSTHFDVVGHGSAHVLAYAGAVVDGTPPPACPTADTLPACR
jgi:hypothetical protein